MKDIGYDQDGFSFHGADVEVLLHGQSPDIAMGVDAKKKKGKRAGRRRRPGPDVRLRLHRERGLREGLVHAGADLLRAQDPGGADRKAPLGQLLDLQPDAKSQVTVRYVDGKAVGCTKVVVSTQHREEPQGQEVHSGHGQGDDRRRRELALPKGWMPKKASDFLVNPTGNFVVGGPDGDCGLTGRKIIVDTYGGYAPHGGGAFSGKDPTKVDRSAAYAARYLAKNVVAAGLADRCLIQVAYAIGVADPMSLYVDTQGTGKVDERKLEKVAAGHLPAAADQHPPRPAAQQADLPAHRGLRPFRPQAEKDGGFSWERTDLADAEARAALTLVLRPSFARLAMSRPASLLCRHAITRSGHPCLSL